MRTKFLIIAFIVFANIFNVPVWSDTTPNKNIRHVSKIEIVVHNNKDSEAQENPKSIEALLQTKQGDVFIQKDFDKDLKSLSEKYENIDSKVYSEDDDIFIKLVLYPKSIIESITFTGNEGIKSGKLKDILNIKTDKPFDQKAFNKAFAELKKYYVKQGYFESQLDYELIPSPNSNEVKIIVSVEEGRSGRIKDIEFVGLNEKEQDELREKLHTKTYFFLTSWATDKGTYDKNVLEQDKMIVLNHLHDQGFADATVDAEIVPTNDSNRIKIQFDVSKGDVYSLGEILFEGNTLFSNEKIESFIGVKKGAIYSPEKIQDTVQNIIDAYGSKGYIDAHVNYELKLDVKKRIYDVFFTIYEGDTYMVGMVKIFGNNNTHNSVILHETLLVPGEVYDIRKLKKTEERLMNVGYFESVNVYAAKSEGKHNLGPNYRDVYIEVEETGTGNLSLFFGYSTLDSIFGGSEISEYNFNHKGIFKLFSEGPSALRGGGEFFKFKFSIGRKYSTFNLGWSKPFFMDTPWEVGFNTEKSFSSLQSDDYEIRALGFSLHASYPLSLFWRFGWNYSIRDSKVSISNTAPEQLRRQSNIDGLVSSSGLTFSYDSTNRPYMPTDGFRSSITGTLAGLGGKVNFLGLDYINTYYTTPHKKFGTFKTRADAQFVQPILGTTSDTIPFDNRLYLGGDTSVRGYRGFSIGPEFSNKDPKGGISSLLLSQEYMHKIYKSISGFVFFDAGTVTDREYRLNKLRSSYGLGVQVEIMPGMPIILGVGFPINPKTRSDIQRPFISIGGRF